MDDYDMHYGAESVHLLDALCIHTHLELAWPDDSEPLRYETVWDGWHEDVYSEDDRPQHPDIRRWDYRTEPVPEGWWVTNVPGRVLDATRRYLVKLKT
jgi:hypothetical protein